MKKLLLFSLLAGACWGQTTPDCQYTIAFTAATAQSPAFRNKPTTSSGVACNAWVVMYWTNGASGVSVQIEGAPDAAGVPGSYTALTAATSPVTSANPATGTTSGIILACCDYYPWIRITPTPLTGTNQTMTVRVYGYKSPTQVAGGGGSGGGSIQLTQDVLAGPGASPQAATVVGLDTVPFCTGFTPTNGQFLKFTTGSAPNPCYTAAVPASGGTIASTTNALVGDGAGNATAAAGTGTNCLLVGGGNQVCPVAPTVASVYTATVSAQTTLSVTAATHGQGTQAWAQCFDSSTPRNIAGCAWSRNTSGDIVFSWSPAFTGLVQISSPTGPTGVPLYMVGGTTDTVICPNNTVNNFASTYTIAAGYLNSGHRALRVTMIFSATTSAAAPSLSVRLTIGGTAVFSPLGAAGLNNLSTTPFVLSFWVQGTAAAGASVPVILSAMQPLSTSGSAWTMTLNAAGYTMSPTSLATNGTLVIQPQLFCSVNTGGNSLTLQGMVVEPVGY